jgi:putative FmdB family regulatory protein
MPLYEYECKACHQRTEKIQSFNAPPETVCPKCGGALERVISAPALQFKGAGWYVNDYAKGSSSSASKNSGAKDKSESAPAAADESSGSGTAKSSDAPASSASPGPAPAASSGS